MSATSYQISLLHHTLGLSERNRESYRNHFVASPGHSDMHHLEALEVAGLMQRLRTPSFLDAGDIVFAVTDAGREVAVKALPEPKKRTRYDEFMDYDDDRSFGEFLCGVQLPEFESRHPPRGENGGRWGYQYRMFRMEKTWCGLHRDVEGDWAPTKKEAKGSYKAALRAKRIGEKK